MNEGSLNGGTPSEMDLDMMVLVDGRFRAHGVGGIKTGNSAVPDVCSCSAQEASTGVNALKFFWSGSASFSAGGEIIVYGVRES